MRIDVPFEIGDDIYWVDSETGEINCEKGAIQGVAYQNGKIYIIDKDGEMTKLRSQWGCLTREEAENFSKMVAQGNLF